MSLDTGDSGQWKFVNVIFPFFPSKKKTRRQHKADILSPCFKEHWKPAGNLLVQQSPSVLEDKDRFSISRYNLAVFMWFLKWSLNLNHLYEGNAISLEQNKHWIARKSLQNSICLCGVISSRTFRETPSCCGQMHFILCGLWYWENQMHFILWGLWYWENQVIHITARPMCLPSPFNS